MNTKFLKFFSFSTLTLSVNLATASTLGILKLEGPVSTYLHHKGSVAINNAQVIQEADVMGKLVAEKTVFYKSVTGAGKASLSDSKLKDDFNFSGLLTLKNVEVDGNVFLRSDSGSVIENSNLKGSFKFAGNELVLTGTTHFKKLVVKPSNEHPISPKIFLTSKEIAGGTVEFEGLPGKVILSAGIIYRGLIINGEIIKE